MRCRTLVALLLVVLALSGGCQADLEGDTTAITTAPTTTLTLPAVSQGLPKPVSPSSTVGEKDDPSTSEEAAGDGDRADAVGVADTISITIIDRDGRVVFETYP